MTCDLCGRAFDSMGYTCRHCESSFCVEHRLPESHDCIVLKHEKLSSEVDSENAQSWFKDEYRLSNVSVESKRSTGGAQQIEVSDQYRQTQASHECSTCGDSLFEHEAAGCPYCRTVFCGEHLSDHRPACDQREAGEKEFEQQQTETKQQVDESQKLKEVAKQVEKKRSPDYEPTPDVAADGSVVEPGSQTSSDTVEEVGDTSARNSNILLLLLGFVVICGILIAVYIV